MNYAVIGVGRMGRRHIHSAHKLGLNLVGILDLHQSSLSEAKIEHNISDNIIFDSDIKLYEHIIPEYLLMNKIKNSNQDLGSKLNGLLIS